MVTLTQFLERAVRLFPDKPLFLFEDDISQFDVATSKLANALVGLGLVKGDSMGFFFLCIPLIAVYVEG